ncbi:FAD-dependent oxidoreductase [Rhodococcus rhodochrous]|uniref:Amino acid dehydrogenase n=1 Tax=Rhodococcus rhodochrous KG-21 TaxID=1441923 RepID=A0A0M8PJ43_RHORH|nr:FAD-dependent oxidoreductase [Rhodococcus rhodochrous]KOS57604.1 amino acid dehydrogenase [Rhodococcus rhodochrous KG-21]
MRTVVIGGGVIGVTTAYYLAKRGHEVTVVEQRSALGQDATGGNAGLIAPGHSFAWASPQAPKMFLRSLRGEATAIRVKLRPDPQFLWWGMQFLRECTPARARQNTLVKLALCQYSQRAMDELADKESIDYHQVSNGAVYLYRDERELELGMQKMQLVADHGQKIRALTPRELADLDPAFEGAQSLLVGAIHGVTDGSGNSELFTQILAERCRSLGVQFDLGVSAQRLVEQQRRVTTLVTDRGDYHADNFVIALGIGSPFLSKTVGQPLPVYPAKGYSLTVDVTDETAAPRIGGVDEATLVAWSRFGNQLRMSSTAEFDGYGRSFRPSDFDNILMMARELFPDAADWSTARMRSCLRPMTPDGPPIIGLGRRHDNLYYNTGHGHMGWTMACGSSLALADTMDGRTPQIDLTPFAVRAFKK